MAHGLEGFGSLVEADDGLQDALRAQLAAPKELRTGLLRAPLVPQGVIAIGVAPIGAGLAGHDGRPVDVELLAEVQPGAGAAAPAHGDDRAALHEAPDGLVHRAVYPRRLDGHAHAAP